MDKNYSGIWIIGILAITVTAIALAVPSLISLKHHVSYETGATQTLRSLASIQATWMYADTDRNGIKDYWTADVSGFYRVEDAIGSTISVADISFAKSDWNPVPAGGKSPVVGALLTPAGTPTAKSGYYYAAFPYDMFGRPYTQDLNGDGFAYENADCYAFQTFPEQYGAAGKLAFIMNENAVVYKIEAITKETGKNAGKSFNNTATYRVLTRPGNIPIPFWPAANPETAGYSR